MNNIQEQVLEKISTGKVAMQPRWYFVLKGALLLSGLVIAALVAIYFLSFVFFALHKTGLAMAPSLGIYGVLFFIVSSPWMLILVVLVFLGILYLLVTSYAFSYKQPLIYSLLGVVLIVIALSSLIQQTAMHERMQRFAEDTRMPAVLPLYRTFSDERPQGMRAGTVTTFTESGFVLTTLKDDVFTVQTTSRTKMPEVMLEIGDGVIVFGKESDGSINAFGVRKIEADGFLFEERRQHLPR